MSWLQNVAERRRSRTEAEWYGMMGVDVVAAEDRAVEERIRKERRRQPTWFQELSSVQIEAADQLVDAVREDYDRNEVDRCLGLLSRLGLNPPAGRRTVKRALSLSRGSDLAFLWFLLETSYFTFRNFGADRKYSINEKILLSCICHLDMITTLRELDQRLPRLCGNRILRRSSGSTFKRCKSPCSPYLEPNPRPKVPQVRLPISRRPKTPSIHPYDAYKDPKYVVRNEELRWFAKFPSPEARPVRVIPSAQQVVQSIIQKDLVNRVTSTSFDKSKVMKSMCSKCRKQKSKDRQQKLLEIILAPPSAPDEPEVVHQIDLDVAQRREDFEVLAERYQKQILVRTLIQDIVRNATALQHIKLCSSHPECVEDLEIYRSIVTRKSCSDLRSEKLDFGHDGKPDEDEIYFRRPTKTSPYEFNYEKIFQDLVQPKARDPVKASLKRALGVDKDLSEDEAIEICMRDMWKFEVELWNEKQREEEELAEQAKAEGLDLEIRNTDRHIEALLQFHLKKMRANPKFMLASLPNVHQLPLLKSFVRARYGFKVSDEVKKREIRRSRQLWDRLLHRHPDIRLPGCADLCPRSFIDWNYKDRATLVANEIRDKFYLDYKKADIRLNDKFWTSMKPSHCNLPISDTFYAYFPTNLKQNLKCAA